MTAPDDAKAIADVLSGARRWCVITGDCLNVLPTIPARSVDAVVTDPPYGLAFMGKRWDYDVPGVEAWGGCLAAMKPGAHLLSFAGTRTQHRMAVRIEDAGFEIRDMIAWVYGSGFPKSLDVSKAIDKAAGVEFNAVPASGVGFMNAEGSGGYNATKNQLVRRGKSTDAARQWSGWGTALKPALEPITVARKPLEGTVAENVLTWGTGAMNVDGCRVEVADGDIGGFRSGTYSHVNASRTSWEAKRDGSPYRKDRHHSGRWPANLIHDGSEEPAALLGDAARFFYCAKASKRDRDEGLDGFEVRACGLMEDDNYDIKTGSGNSRDTRRANHHPTVKPTELMRYLCRLVTPNDGVVLDPFAGSGSTGKAALAAGFRFIGIELDPHYADIARRRIAEAAETLWTTEPKPEQGSLFPPTPGPAPAGRGASA